MRVIRFAMSALLVLAIAVAGVLPGTVPALAASPIEPIRVALGDKVADGTIGVEAGLTKSSTWPAAASSRVVTALSRSR